MSDNVTAVTITVPTTATAANPQRTVLNLGWSDVVGFKIVFAPGCVGLVGARVEYGQNPVYPDTNGTWYIFDNYVLDQPVSSQQQGGTWDIACYNNDVYAHTLWVYFDWNNLTSQEQAAVVSTVSLVSG